MPAYNIYAASCCEYLMQFTVFPDALFKREPANLAKILKIPCRGFGLRGPFHLTDVGLHKAVSLADLNLAVLFRAANKTLNWQSWPDQIRTAAEAHLSINDSTGGNVARGFWDSSPIVFLLEMFGGVPPMQSFFPPHFCENQPLPMRRV